ncbi:hypothetical protein SIFV0015 [Sulfolobus islandicus filamentous virus]|uniref:Uncharacterized protein 15 n=1 Tax=Sulfolobus islandicus filamentous virus (isolate Iceland/Hveragerdi) TaxID=654908 RepID=Y015_SIFVH|nr:hypothetical protein SIFV0015 [Sulfolobus islandicus filamentous virus]Q914L5.1 RecName: Full=Uncharacterized protein 15 [Sulfolobus islandicus filamentous virus (isolate Hveragerdi)]AAL27726.1 hypothetical protein [Sulfolobus islandicus filamentous virus]
MVDVETVETKYKIILDTQSNYVLMEGRLKVEVRIKGKPIIYEVQEVRNMGYLIDITELDIADTKQRIDSKLCERRYKYVNSLKNLEKFINFVGAEIEVK